MSNKCSEIAVVYMNQEDSYDRDYNSVIKIVASSITDWATVTEEELSVLQTWVNNNRYRDSNSPLIIYKESSAGMPLLIQQIIAEAKKAAIKAAERKRKAAAVVKNREEASVAKEEAKKLKQYLKLKKEFEGA